MLAIRIAAWTAADTAGGIAFAELTATFNFSGFSAELRAIKSRKETFSAHLPGNRSERILGRCGTAGRVLRRIAYTTSGATVRIANQHAAELVDGNVIEVEQIAAGIAASLIPDAAALHGVGRRGVGGCPSAAAVVGDRDIQMPDTQEIGRLRVARSRSP